MDTFITRQPIFDKDRKVFAYELLFRSGLENYFEESDQMDKASEKVGGDSILVHGLDALTGGKKAFYEVSQEILLKEYYAILPKEQATIEISENVEPDPEVIAACTKLKENGYSLVLPNLDDQDRYAPLLDLSDIIKVDFLSTNQQEQQQLVERFAPKDVRMFAEKVESWEVFKAAREMGYVYFQGSFSSKPTGIIEKEIPAFKLHYLQILEEIQRPALNYKELEKIIKLEVSLSYKLLRYINSAFFGWQKEISSIHHALVLLGETEIKKWASLMATASMAEDTADELVVQAIVRAKFCESLATKIGSAPRSQDFFLMGMFSLIDAIMNTPISEILDKLPISNDIKNALLEQEGVMGEVYQAILAYEQGDWGKLSELAEKFEINDEEISKIYIGALELGNNSFINKA